MGSQRDRRIERLIREFRNEKSGIFTVEELAMILRLFNHDYPPQQIELDEIEMRIRERVKNIRDVLKTLDSSKQ